MVKQAGAGMFDEPGLPGFAPPAPVSTAAPSAAPLPTASGQGGAYRVLARKYRPIHFGDLIGQEPMVCARSPMPSRPGAFRKPGC